MGKRAIFNGSDVNQPLLPSFADIAGPATWSSGEIPATIALQDCRPSAGQSSLDGQVNPDLDLGKIHIWACLKLWGKHGLSIQMVIFNGEYDDKPSNEPSNVGDCGALPLNFQTQPFSNCRLWVILVSPWRWHRVWRPRDARDVERGAIGTQEKPMKVELTHDSY